MQIIAFTIIIICVVFGLRKSLQAEKTVSDFRFKSHSSTSSRIDHSANVPEDVVPIVADNFVSKDRKEISLLQNEIDSQREKIKYYHDLTVSQSDAITKHLVEINRLRLENESLTRETAASNKNARKADAIVSEKCKKIAELESEIACLQSKLVEQKTSEDKKAEAREAEAKRLTSVLNNLMQKKMSEDKDAETRTAEGKRLASALAECISLKETVNSLNSEILHLNSKIIFLQSQKSNSYQHQSADLSLLQEQISKKNEEIQKLKQALSRQNSEKKILPNEIQELKDKHKKLRDRLRLLEEDIVRKDSEISSMNKASAIFQQEQVKLSRMHENLISDYESKKRECNKLKSDLENQTHLLKKRIRISHIRCIDGYRCLEFHADILGVHIPCFRYECNKIISPQFTQGDCQPTISKRITDVLLRFITNRINDANINSEHDSDKAPADCYDFINDKKAIQTDPKKGISESDLKKIRLSGLKI